MSSDIKEDAVVATSPQEVDTSINVLQGLTEDRPIKRAIAVATLLIATIIFQIIIIAVPIWLSDEDRVLTSAASTVYTTAMTILATIISTLAITLIRAMWLRRLLHQSTQGQPVQTLTRRAQVLVNLSSVNDQFTFYSISIVLAAASLITASITGSTSISSGLRQHTLSRLPLHVQDIIGELECYQPATQAPTNNHTLAWLVQNTGSSDSSYVTASHAYAADLYSANSTSYNSSFSGLVGCPLESGASFTALEVLQGVGYQSRSVFASSDTIHLDICHNSVTGVVTCSALGAPLDFNSACDIFRPFDCHHGAVTEACVPTFVRNPVTCRLGDNVTTSGGDIQSIITDTCSVTASSSGPNALIRTETGGLIGFCPGSALGDIDVAIGLGRAPSTLRRLILDLAGSTDQPDNVVARCSLSMNNTLDFSIVTNNTARIDTLHGIYDDVPVLNGTGRSCKPSDTASIADIQTDSTRLAAASFLFSILEDSRWTELDIFDEDSAFGEDMGHYDYALNGSANILEDFLGTLVASRMGYYFAGLDGIPANWQNTRAVEYWATYSTYAARVGPGSPAAIVYILPSLSALLVIGWLFVGDWRAHRS